MVKEGGEKRIGQRGEQGRRDREKQRRIKREEVIIHSRA